jgi:phenylpropionate dioxygenase-like ring-hydroxylating dioxygenase large terminal subunit
MLNREDNELLCRVGPGTAMGNTLRQYWLPILLSSELPGPDCPPEKIKLLGEQLVAFRTTDGEVGLMADNCPHRGASMFFGRNEENGLRCVYHGWKFDTSGTCVDMPNEPPESNFKHKVRIQTYPTSERNGVIWAYLGPRETPPDSWTG